jgi:hypothetical protein
MNTDKLNSLSVELDGLITGFLVPVRVSKTIDPKCLARLQSLLDEIGAELEPSIEVPKKLVGTLYAVVFSLLGEADHADDPEPIEHVAWDIQERLRRIFGPRF